MLNSQRRFVDAVRRYCANRGIAIEVRSLGWLIVMQQDGKRHFAYGYDLGLNSSVAHRIASDKAATAEILQASGIACVAHTLFLCPRLSAFAPAPGPGATMHDLLSANPAGLVVKPNEGTSGRLVFKVSASSELEDAASRIFALDLNLAISPQLAIEDEVRVILIDDDPVVVYSKQRPAVTGDGIHTVRELARATIPPERLAAVLSRLAEEFGESALAAIPPAGQRQVLNWRHNLDSGAVPVLLEPGTTRDDCVAIAVRASCAIGLRFGSVDVVNVDGAWRILEINSGVMMEALGQSHPELVERVYSAALDKVFA